MHETDCFVIFLVEARHLDYTNCRSFLKTVAKHPSDGSKNSDVGHAWIYLQKREGDCVYILEGGQTGDTGRTGPRYFEGLIELSEQGDPNPVRYLTRPHHDGFFEWGSGKHAPTYAAKVDLNDEEYEAILKLIESYDFKHYSLVQNSCCSFVEHVACIKGLLLNSSSTMVIPPSLCNEIPLWTDSRYSSLTFDTPDQLEKSLMELVESGVAEDALYWYRTHRYRCFSCWLKKVQEDLFKLPQRTARALLFLNF